jgi:hypothetical protein
MLIREDDVDAHALHRRGWSISAIARHLGMTARPSAPICTAAASPDSADARCRIRSNRLSTTAGNG